MLSLLKISNIALIDNLEIEFGHGLNLLTGETGSGKSIIVDSLGALTGERISSDLIKQGADSARIEGLFTLLRTKELDDLTDQGGIELDESEEIDLIVRRELSLAGKNRIFINNQLVTQSLLRRIGPLLVDIHGQGEQAALFDPASHLEMLDDYAGVAELRTRVAETYKQWSATRSELDSLKQDEADKLQLLDILKFQADEIGRASLKPGEDEELEEEKRRLNNVEKLSTLSEDAYTLLYESDESTVATLEKAARKIDELAEYDSRFTEYKDSITTAQAVLEDLAITTRDFRNHLEFSPDRLEEIESRLAEISRLTRKYGGTIDSVLAHLKESSERLENIETAEFREAELRKKLAEQREQYIVAASNLNAKRTAAARKFETAVEKNLKTVALEKARFEVRIDSPDAAGLKDDQSDRAFSTKGFDRVEFFFSANPGEPPKPLSKVASGGEASRLMLIIKTTAKGDEVEKAVVFDEVDTGIGGRVAEAVGVKLKELARSQQVLCVTHQPQVASQADLHFVVEKSMAKNKTTIGVRELDEQQRIEEVARMLAGEHITDAARQNAREMIERTRQRGGTAAG